MIQICITSTSMSTIPSSLPTSRFPQELRRCTNSYQVSDVSAVISIESSTMETVSNLIQLTVFEWIRLNVPIGFDSLFPTLFDILFSVRFNLQFPIRFESVFFYSIWVKFNIFISNLNHIIRVKLQSGFKESHIGRGVFKITQHWNRGIFHNY